ncbi:hypothetical protein IF2G_02333 [Cordyceps javanica]|nr:hypothetical protein IF2G_02333 [Cordyceps javanica]
MSTRQATLSLYRRSLRLALDWAVQRQLWRGQLQALLSETEKLLNGWKHPDPYVPPTAPGEENVNFLQDRNTKETCHPQFWIRLTNCSAATPSKWTLISHVSARCNHKHGFVEDSYMTRQLKLLPIAYGIARSSRLRRVTIYFSSV